MVVTGLKLLNQPWWSASSADIRWKIFGSNKAEKKRRSSKMNEVKICFAKVPTLGYVYTVFMLSGSNVSVKILSFFKNRADINKEQKFTFTRKYVTWLAFEGRQIRIQNNRNFS